MNIMRLLKWPALLALLTDLLSVFGLFGLIITITGYFASLFALNELLKTTDALVVLFVVGVTYALKKNWPKTDFEYKLDDKDIRIQLHIGDVFDLPGAIVVPINSSFDVDLGGTVLKTTSIQAQVIKKYYDSKCNALQRIVKNKLNGNLQQNIGVTVSVERDARKFYFLASSKKISEEKVQSDRRMLTEALIGLWSFLSDFGTKEEIIIPLIGTGNARISSTREDVFKEIVRSFLASCHAKSYCDKLIIVINESDVGKWEIDVDELNEFLKFSCKYSYFAPIRAATVGTPVS